MYADAKAHCQEVFNAIIRADQDGTQVTYTRLNGWLTVTAIKGEQTVWQEGPVQTDFSSVVASPNPATTQVS
jgi:hypothetical protein